MSSIVDLIKYTENDKYKLILINYSSLNELLKYYNLIVLSKEKDCYIKGKKTKETKIIFDILNINDIKMIEDENIFYYVIPSYILFLIYSITFRFNIIVKLEKVNIFIHYSIPTSDDELFGCFPYNDKRNIGKLLCSAKIKKFNVDLECPICYEKLNKENIIKTNCNHYFCKKCISKLNSLLCPMCRGNIRKLNSAIICSNIIDNIKEKINKLNSNILLFTKNLRIKYILPKTITIQKYKRNWDTNDFVNVFFYNCPEVLYQISKKNYINKNFFLFF